MSAARRGCFWGRVRQDTRSVVPSFEKPPPLMRQIVLDTETTGLEPAAGHRVIEIGCVELVNRRPTQNRFHRYINPEREVDRGALEVHGIENEFLATQPKFAEVAREFIEFVKGAELVIHNADFDVEFLNHELKRLPGSAGGDPRLLRRARHARAGAAPASRAAQQPRRAGQALQRRQLEARAARRVARRADPRRHLSRDDGRAGQPVARQRGGARCGGRRAVELRVDRARARPRRRAARPPRKSGARGDARRDGQARRADLARARARRGLQATAAAPRSPPSSAVAAAVELRRLSRCDRARCAASAAQVEFAVGSSGEATLRSIKDTRIGIIGLGYVGLPLAVEFGKHYPTVGFDIKKDRIAELERGNDSTLETTSEELRAAKHLQFFDGPAGAGGMQHVHRHGADARRQEQSARADAAERRQRDGRQRAQEGRRRRLRVHGVSRAARKSTACRSSSRQSGLKFNKDFFCGYSPERINPGDKEHRLPTIKKITSGSTPEIADYVDALYRSIITAGTHKASSLKVAEAAKVIENTQRDINIALINELSMIFQRLGIDTEEVLKAAGTKWNFLNFRPGLVGGHCIGVDPYYLTHKAEEVGYRPEIILAGRRLNDSMAEHVAMRVLKLMISRNIQPSGARVLVLGLTFKENCPDVRNTKVADVVRELQELRLQRRRARPVGRRRRSRARVRHLVDRQPEARQL